jgi:hypothetical protein
LLIPYFFFRYLQYLPEEERLRSSVSLLFNTRRNTYWNNLRLLSQFTEPVSPSFDAADASFTGVTAPYLNSFAGAELNILLAVIEANAQTWQRRRASIDHQQVLNRVYAVLGRNSICASFQTSRDRSTKKEP